MKKLLCLFLLSRVAASTAQNLVANPSFESYIACPAYLGQIEFPSTGALTVSDWFKPTIGSSDYFNSCSGAAIYGVSVPQNGVGIQEAHYGQAYAGAICYSTFMGYPDYREYVESRLLSPMIAGHLYFASFYTSLAERREEDAPVVAIDRMGLYFANEVVEMPAYGSVLSGFVPQVESPHAAVLADTAQWMSIAGTYKAAGGEEWIVGGNFTPADSLTIEIVSPGTGGRSSYYYFDDFCVLDINTIAERTKSNTVICPGSEIQLHGAEGYTNYVWDDGSTDQVRSLGIPGTYWVASIDANTCSGRVDSIGILYEAIPELQLGGDTIICKGEQVFLDAGNPAFHSYLWNTGDTTAGIIAAYPGTYTVAASSACYTIKDTIVLNIPPEPEADLGPDINLCKGGEATIGNAGPGLSYIWNTGSQACCITVTASGIYSVTALNSCGETASDTVTVTFSDCDYCILVPNAFSPNGDGVNDRFDIYAGCPVTDYRLNIFNRWGQLVYSSYDPGAGWDGNVNGRPADVGTYFSTIEATPAIDHLSKITKKGDLTLVR